MSLHNATSLPGNQTPNRYPKISYPIVKFAAKPNLAPNSQNAKLQLDALTSPNAVSHASLTRSLVIWKARRGNGFVVLYAISDFSSQM